MDTSSGAESQPDDSKMPLIFRSAGNIRYSKPKYRLRWMKNKGGVLVVLWSFLVYSVFHAFDYMTLDGSKKINSEIYSSPKPTGIILISLALLFPVGGWLADSYLGRYRTIRYSTWIMWLSVIAVALWYILSEYVLFEYSSKRTVVLVILYVIMGIGLAGFQANIIQLGIDQLTDASSIEITSFITNYVTTLYTSGVAFYFINSCYGSFIMTVKGYNLLMMLYVAICLTMAVCLDLCFGSCLVKEDVPVTTNSVILITKVVRYVLKHRNRIFGEATNAFDVAKRYFGGPYENHHVDQVKRFLKMVVVTGVANIVCGQVIIFSYARSEMQLRFCDWDRKSCFLDTSIRHSNYISGTLLILSYEVIIYPLFHRWIPTVRTPTVFLIGIFISLLTTFAYLGVEVGAYLEQPHSGCNITTAQSNYRSCLHHDNVNIQFSSLWVIILGSLEGVYSLLFLLSAYQFVWSQAPPTMKGLILGIMYAFLGLSVMFQSAISAPFLFIPTTPWSKLPLSCGIWYYSMQVLIIFGTFSLFSFIVKRYKRSQREEVGLHPVSLVHDIDNEP